MWRLLKGLFAEEAKQSSVDKMMDRIKEEALSVEVVQVVEQPPQKLREPVQVLLDSLEEGWWSFKSRRVSLSAESIEATHEWLGTTLTLTQIRVRGDCYESCYENGTTQKRFVPAKYEWHVEDEWLSLEEDKIVTAAVLQAKEKLARQRHQRALDVRDDLKKLRVEKRESEFFKLLELKEKE